MLVNEDFCKTKSIYHKALFNEIIALLYVTLTFTLGFTVSKLFATRESAVYNSYRVVDLELRIGIFWEKSIQSAFLNNAGDFLVIAFNNFYLMAHIPVSVAFLIWVFHFRNKQYYLFRNAFLLGHTVCIITQFLFPCAPPRLLSEMGFVDTMLAYSGSDLMDLEEAAGVNPYAAVPSMHFSYAFLVGTWGFYLTEGFYPRILYPLYTMMVTFGVIVTGNHFLFDCGISLIINVLSYLLVLRWKDIKQIVKRDSELALENPNYWWLFIILVFGSFSLLLHILIRTLFFVIAT